MKQNQEIKQTASGDAISQPVPTGRQLTWMKWIDEWGDMRQSWEKARAGGYPLNVIISNHL